MEYYLLSLLSQASTVGGFKVILTLPIFPLLAPFLSSNNFSFFLKLWSGVDV